MRQYEWEGHCPYGGGVFLCVCCGHGCYGKISCLWGLLQYTYLQFFEDTYVSSRFTMSSTYHDNYGLGYKRQNFHLTINCISQDYPYQLKTFSFLLSFPNLNLICTLHLHILYYVGIPTVETINFILLMICGNTCPIHWHWSWNFYAYIKDVPKLWQSPWSWLPS